MLYLLPVMWLMKVLEVDISLQHLHHLLPQGALPVLVGGAGVDRLALTSRSLRLLSLLKATNWWALEDLL